MKVIVFRHLYLIEIAELFVEIKRLRGYIQAIEMLLQSIGYREFIDQKLKFSVENNFLHKSCRYTIRKRAGNHEQKQQWAQQKAELF